MYYCLNVFLHGKLCTYFLTVLGNIPYCFNKLQFLKKSMKFLINFFLKIFSNNIMINFTGNIYSFQYCFETNLYLLDLNRFSAILKSMYSIELQIIFHEYQNKINKPNTSFVSPGISFILLFFILISAENCLYYDTINI